MTRQELRKAALEARKMFTEEEVIHLSVDIANRLLTLPIWSHQVYHLFMSIAHQKEVQTEPILTLLQAKEKTVVVPKMQPDGRLKHYILEDETQFEMHRFGVPEPINGKEINVAKIEVVFVPLLCFDRKGHRLGYGKGFYDRFLAETSANTVFIGLSLLDNIEETIEPEAHDVPLHYVVTPKAVHRFNP